MTTIGERIKEALEKRDMIQLDLAEKTGIAKSAISSYINGKYEPKQNTIHLMAKALAVNEAWLMGYDVPMTDDDIMPKEVESMLEYFKSNPELKSLFRIVDDLSPEDIDFLIEMAKKMKGR